MLLTLLGGTFPFHLLSTAPSILRGYYGISSMFVPERVQQKAYQAEGVNLDFYRDYNVSWKNVGIYFANPGALS